jgi:hypothetical protein
MSKTLLDLRSKVNGSAGKTTPLTPEPTQRSKKPSAKIIVEHVETNQLEVDVLASLQVIKESDDGDTVALKDGNKLVVQPDEARVIHDTYLSLNEANQAEMKNMLNESLSSFSKVIFFSYKNAKEA